MRELGLRKDFSCVVGLKGLAALLRFPQDRKTMEVCLKHFELASHIKYVFSQISDVTNLVPIVVTL